MFKYPKLFTKSRLSKQEVKDIIQDIDQTAKDNIQSCAIRVALEDLERSIHRGLEAKNPDQMADALTSMEYFLNCVKECNTDKINE